MPDIRPLRTISELRPGDHACCLYETAEKHRAVLTPFLRQGLERGEKVVYILDVSTVEAILAYLRGDGLDVEPYLARGQMVFLTRDETYMQGGVFDLERMIALLRAQMDQALAEGYPALRITGEMGWALRGLPGSERLIEYEGKLNEFFPGSRCIALCQYDWRSFGPQLLMDVLSIHAVAVVNAILYDNYYYVSPATVLGHGVSAAQLRHWSKYLAERGRPEEAVVRTIERQMERQNVYHLTFRELTILRVMAIGKSDGEIATALHISLLTAHKHVANILGKMGAASRTEASTRALREGLVE
jgi:DNA-binding CsgD family transcriptional regulator